MTEVCDGGKALQCPAPRSSLSIHYYMYRVHYQLDNKQLLLPNYT